MTEQLENWTPEFWERSLQQMAGDPELKALYLRAYRAYPEWLAYLRSDPTPIANETLHVCERLPEMASGIWVAGYITALVEESAPPERAQEQ